MEEIYDIAKNASEEGAFEGLMYLERAQNSTKFSIPHETALLVLNSLCSRSTKTTFQPQSAASCTTSP